MSQPNSSKESTRYQSLSDCFQNLLSQTNARQESSGQFKGTCPAHDDHKASLSLKLEDNQILLNCFAGCDFNNVCEKLGVDPKELFADPYQDDPPPRKSETVAEYVYTNPDGSPRFVVIRKEDKRFLQARINRKGSREYSMKDVKRIPYRLPQLIKAIENGKTLLLVEGEKDVETAEKLGFIATTFPQGAGKSEVTDQCIEWLKDAEVVLIPDNDESGQSHMQMIGKKLLPVARSIRLLQLPDLGEKEDLSDWVQKGGTSEDLKKLVDESPAFIPSGSPAVSLPSDFDIESIKRDLPALPRNILPTELETYLELSAESLDLNYEAAFCEFLMNASVAIGGNKWIVIKSDWLEKACIWLASIGKSGYGKTPLHRKCGGKWLEEQQYRWKLDHDEALREWKKILSSKDREEEPPEKPTRKRVIVSGLTMERLFALHEENAAGIGIVSDEILGLLNGLNQYKGRGNDRQKMISFWNGHATEYPTADSDRYVRNPHIPICGGIQDDQLKKFINDESHSDGLAARFLYNHLIRSPLPASIERQEIVSNLIAQSEGKQILEKVFEGLLRIRENSHQVLMNVHAKNLLALLEQQLKDEDRKVSDAESAAYNKMRTYIYRVALLLHYVFETKPEEVELSEETAQKTITVMRFFIASMQRAYGTVELNKKEVVARKILNKVAEIGGRGLLRHIKQPLKRSATSDEFDSILEILVETGELIETKEGKTFQYSLP